MSRCMVWTACLCWLALLGAAAAQTPASPDIGIVQATTGAGGARTLTMQVEQASFDWPVVIRRNDSGAETAHVTVDFTPLVGPSTTPAENQLLVLNDQTVKEAVLDLASQGQGTVRLKGTLPVKGDFKGQVGVLLAGKPRTVYEVVITRRDPSNPPKAVIVGAGNDNKLAMTSDRAVFEWPFTVRRDDSVNRNVEIRVAASTMTGPSGRPVHPELFKDGQTVLPTIKLGPLAQQALTLKGTADAEGAYTGELTIETEGVRSTVTLTLTRTRPELEIKVDPIARLRDTSGGAVTLRARLQNPTGIVRDINRPMLSRLDLVNASGATPVDIGVGSYELHYKIPGQTAQDPPLQLAGDAGLDLQLMITGLDAPGNYKGAIRFSAPDRKPIDAPFELALRLCWIWAALAIGVGAAFAAGLRYFQQQGRPRLLLQREVLALRSRLGALVQAAGADLNPRERSVIRRLMQELDEASDDLANQPIDPIRATVALVRRKFALLPPWIEARRRHDALRPPAVAAQIEPELDSVFAALTDSHPTDAELTAAETTLRGIEDKIRDALKQYLIAAVTAVRAAIDQFPLAERLQFDPVQPELTDVEAAANTNHIDLARAALDRARASFAVIGAALLRSKLDTARPAIGFDAAAWSTFTTEIKALLDAIPVEPDIEQRMRRWTEANRRYLVEVVRRAKARIDFLVPSGIATPELTTASNRLAEALAALAAGAMATAWTAYDAATVAADHARPALTAAGQQLGATPNADSTAPQAGGGVPDAAIDAAIGSIMLLPLGRDVTAAAVDRSLLVFTIGFGVAILIIAILSGLQLLYVPNPAFGLADLLVAFLWGAGLHAVAGQAFQGLQGLGQQFR